MNLKTIFKKGINIAVNTGARILRAIGADQILIATLNNSSEVETAFKEYYQRQEEHRRAHVLDRRI